MGERNINYAWRGRLRRPLALEFEYDLHLAERGQGIERGQCLHHHKLMNLKKFVFNYTMTAFNVIPWPCEDLSYMRACGILAYFFLTRTSICHQKTSYAT